MKILKLFKLAKKLGINKGDLNYILREGTVKSSMSNTTVELYKSGTHYGTISIRNFQ